MPESAAADLEYFYSGGASNTDPAASLGGVISSAVGGELFGAIPSYNGVSNPEIPGVTLRRISRSTFLASDLEANGGIIRQSADVSGNQLLNAREGSSGTLGPTVTLEAGVDRRYDLQYRAGGGGPATDPLRYISIDVDWSSIIALVNPNIEEAGFDVTYQQAELFRNLISLDFLNGLDVYRCIYLKNNGLGGLANVRMNMRQIPTFGRFWLGVDPAGVGDGVSTGVATTIPDETTAPGGVTFTEQITAGQTPIDITPTGGPPDEGGLNPGEVIAIWIRYVLPIQAVPGGIVTETPVLGVLLET